MKTFAHFPEDVKCPVCGTSEDKPCVLVPLDGTEDDGNVEAMPVHADCINVRCTDPRNGIKLLYQRLE